MSRIFLHSENKVANQLCSNGAADLHLCKLTWAEGSWRAYSIPMVLRPAIFRCPSVVIHNFKHLLLWNHLADQSQKWKLLIFQNFCSLWPETNWDNEDMWVLKVKVISWPWPKVIYIWKLKLAFLRNDWAILNQFYFVLGPNIRWAFHRTSGPLVLASYTDTTIPLLSESEISSL